MTIEIIQMFIPKSNKFTRPGRKMTPTSITDHETANTNVRANARAHALLQFNGNRRQASWHFTVDDERQVYQSLPVDEVGYHAGNSVGNNTSIGVERCVNVDGDYLQTLAHAVELYRWLIKTIPTIVKIKQHNIWSGKDCPKLMRRGHKGVNWDMFIARVKGEPNNVAKSIKPVKSVETVYVTTNINFKIGDKVRIKKSATNYATGERIPSSIKGRTDTIMQRGSNRMLLKDIYSWVKTSDLELVEGSKTNTAATKITTSKPTLKVGAKVKIKPSATTYSRTNGVVIPSRFKNKTYTIQQISKNDVLIKELYSWIRKSDLIGNTSSVSSSSKSSSDTKKQSISQMATRIINDKNAPTGHEARRKWLGVDDETYQKVHAEVNRRLK